MTAQLQVRRENGRDLGVLVWRWPEPLLAIASGPLGGGIGLLHWAVNAQVASDYARRDPDRHLARLAAELGLAGPGAGMLTAADVTARQAAIRDGVAVTATVGLGLPLLAAAPEHAVAAGQAAAAGRAAAAERAEATEHGAAAPAAVAEHGAAAPAAVAEQAAAGRAPAAPAAGTINIVAVMPARLSQAALVNAVITVTEAKTQALMAAGLEATGTATDAVCVACPAAGPAEAFCGPRSPLGAPLASAVHAAVRAGAASWLARTSS